MFIIDYLPPLLSIHLDKVHQQFVADGNTYSSEDLRGAKRSFCAAITRINNASQTIGKDGKVLSLYVVYVFTMK